MRAIATPTPTSSDDPTRALIEAVKSTWAEMEGYSVADLTDDTEMAELIGRLKSLVGVLLSVVDR